MKTLCLVFISAFALVATDVSHLISQGAFEDSYDHRSVRHIYPEIEEKTIIYVLTGRNDGVQVNDNGEIQLPQPKTPSKPEVVFVRYNNENDAQRAISDIQNQYNSQQGASVSVIGARNSVPN